MKRGHVVEQGGTCPPQPQLQPADLPDAAADPLGVLARKLTMGLPCTMQEAAIYLGYQGPRRAEVAARFLRSRGTPLLKRGTVLLVRPQDLARLFDPAGVSDRDRHAATIARDMAQRKASSLRAVVP